LIKYISKNTKKNTDDVIPIYIMSDRN